MKTASDKDFENSIRFLSELAAYQMLLAKPDAAGAAHLPLTRRDW